LGIPHLAAHEAGSPAAGSDRSRPEAGRGIPSMGSDTSLAMRVCTAATPGRASMRLAIDSGARSREAKTCAKRCRS
jgi:hypothetical protein